MLPNFGANSNPLELMTAMIMEKKKMTKRNTLQQVQKTCNVIKRNIEHFRNKFNNMREMVIPTCGFFFFL